MTVADDALLRLADRGPRGLEEILRMAVRGDWRTRALSLSAAGRIARAEGFTRRAARWAARRVPGLRPRFPSAGHHGKYVRNDIGNALVDRSWVVRTAAALALGECRAPEMISALRPLLSGPYRAERIAAAAALVCCGERAASLPPVLLAGAFPSPLRIGNLTRSIDFLTTLASCHLEVLARWQRTAGAHGPGASTAEGWAAFLAGSMSEEVYAGTGAEIERYDAEGETDYLFTKPFSRINRRQNVRLLHAFLVAAEHLRVPQDGRVLDLGGGSGWVSELLAKLGFAPMALTDPVRQVHERARLAPELDQVRVERPAQRRRKAGTDAASGREALSVVVADHERIDAIAHRREAADHKFLGVLKLHFGPGAASAARFIGRVDPFRDDPLDAETAQLALDGGRRAGQGCRQEHVRVDDHLAQGVSPRRQRRAHEPAALAHEHVEGVVDDRHGAAGAAMLKRLKRRMAMAIEGHDLAVEDAGLGVDRSQSGSDGGVRAGQVGAVARAKRDAIALFDGETAVAVPLDLV